MIISKFGGPLTLDDLNFNSGQFGGLVLAAA